MNVFNAIWWVTLARVTKASCAAFLFAACPFHAARAEAWRARPYENVSFQGLCRGVWLIAFRFREASSSLWPPERKQMPEKQKKDVAKKSIQMKIVLWVSGKHCLTWYSSWHCASESSYCCHGNLLWTILFGAGVSSHNHVWFEQSALQIHMVVRERLVYSCQDLGGDMLGVNLWRG